MLERGVVPVVPAKGSVGSSGDLAPLAHVALVLVGEGVAELDGERLDGRRRRWRARACEPVEAGAQGGAGAHQRHAPHGGGRRAGGPRRAARCSTSRSSRWRCRWRRSRARPSRSTSAWPACARTPARRRSRRACARCWTGSEVVASHADCGRVQDPYTLRCAPQVLGAIDDALSYIEAALERELHAVTDNPLVFPDGRRRRGRRQLPRPAAVAAARPPRPRPVRAGLLQRAAHLRAALPQLRRAAGLPLAAPGAVVGADAHPVRGGRAGQRVPGARASRPAPARSRPRPARRTSTRWAPSRRSRRAPWSRTARRSSPPSSCAPARASSSIARCAPRAPLEAAVAKVRAIVPRVEDDRVLSGELAALAEGCGPGRSCCEVPRLGAGGCADDAREQPASRRRRAPGGPRRLRRDRQGRARPRVAAHRSSASCSVLGGDETLLVQSGKPVAVFETHPDAPRVLIANSNLVPQWATWEHFRALDAAGLMMYGQMTAGSWIYIGTQGILQGTYETFAAVARKRFGGTLAGRLVVTAGLGGMGGAQPLAVTMNGGCALCVEVDLQRIERRIETGYLDERAADLDDALRRLDAARGRARGAVDRAVRQRGRGAARARAPRRGDRRRHRPDERPRPAQRLRPRRADASSRPTSLRVSRPRRLPAPRGRERGRARGRHPAAAGGRRRGVRLRQRAARAGRRPRRQGRVRLPRLRARLHPPAVLRGQGPVPLGGAVGRPGRHPCHRRRDPRALRRPGAHRALDRPGARARAVPGAAGAHLLAGLRRARPRRGCASTRWSPAASCAGRS